MIIFFLYFESWQWIFALVYSSLELIFVRSGNYTAR